MVGKVDLLAFKIAFCSMKRLGLFRFLSRWDATLSQITPPAFYQVALTVNR